MATLDALLQAVVDDPLSEDRWLVLADWLDGHDDPRRAELLRLHRRLLATCCEPDRHPARAGWQARIVDLIGQGVRPCVPQRRVVLADGVEMAFSYIPPGSFLMGSPASESERSDHETQHRVTLTKGHYLAIHPVTQLQWQAVMSSNPSSFEGNDRPVEAVSWGDCVAYCERLGEKVGQRFRLPMEAEWEHACRAGTTTAYHTGNGLEAMKRAGWCNCGSSALTMETKPVGQFEPNAWGLFDMHGNVFEWMADWFESYPDKEVEDPQIAETGNCRVLRGGSWYHNPGWCRSAFRIRGVPVFRNDDYGCRVLLCLD